MAENLGKWPSKRGSINKIMPSDGCGRNAVPLTVERSYGFPEFSGYLGNVGLTCLCCSRIRAQHMRTSMVLNFQPCLPSGAGFFLRRWFGGCMAGMWGVRRQGEGPPERSTSEPAAPGCGPARPALPLVGRALPPASGTGHLTRSRPQDSANIVRSVHPSV